MKKVTVALMLSSVALAGLCLAGCSSASGTTEMDPIMTENLNTSDETSASGNTIGAYKTQDVWNADNDSYEFKTLSTSEIDDVYTFTVEGHTYTLPFDASQLVADGWECEEADYTIAANMCDSPATEAAIYIDGDTTKFILPHFLNDSNEAKSWKDCKVVGVTIYNSEADFQTSKGIKIGDTFAQVQEAYGASSFEVDRFGSVGYHFQVRNDASLDGNRWYGQECDSLVFTADNVSLYPNWIHEGYVHEIHMDYFKGINATE